MSAAIFMKPLKAKFISVNVKGNQEPKGLLVLDGSQDSWLRVFASSGDDGGKCSERW